jgi:DNA polymerase-3 subunit gamma/tau
VAYRIITPLEIRGKKSAGSVAAIVPKKQKPAPSAELGPKLVIEETKQMPVATTSLGALSKIRQEVVNRKTAAGAGDSRSLDYADLMETWSQFTADLKKNKNSAAQSFAGAELRILDEQRFEILTNNNLEQRFIEQEKRKLSDLLQQRFQNKLISFSVVIREQTVHSQPQEKTWSKREQFQQIVEIYPLVKELKDKLKLELDY